LKEENEKLRVAMENSNAMMKKQINNLHEWQTQVTKTKEEQLKSEENARTVIEELKRKNGLLEEKVKDLEGHAGLKLVEEMGIELASLRSKLDEQENRENDKTSLETNIQNMRTELMQSEERNQLLTKQFESLNSQIQDLNEQLKSMTVLEQQISIYERDFKVEEIAKMAAIKEIEGLEKQVEQLKSEKCELEEKIELGKPIVDLKVEETLPPPPPSSTVGHKERHHSRDERRNSRRAGKL